jgi:hypothetical protein
MQKVKIALLIVIPRIRNRNFLRKCASWSFSDGSGREERRTQDHTSLIPVESLFCLRRAVSPHRT